MFATETDNPQPEAVQDETSADLTEETPKTDSETDTEAAEPTARQAAESAAKVPEETKPSPPERAPIIDYLAPNLLGDITTVTADQLKAMEEPEKELRNEALEELISNSVGEIREDRVIKGRVIGSNDREVLVDIGFKSEGIVAREEFGAGGLPAIGDEITVYLVRMEDINGQTVLSKEKADFMGRWSELKEKEASGETVMGVISRRIKGGLIVDLGGVPAFLPGSQVDIRPVQDFDDYIGREFEFKIVKINESRKNIVLSRKELLEADMKEKRAELISGLEVGQVLEGRVKNLTDFGAFVDLGGLDGLLHITDLSWGRVQHPSEVVSLDEVITIKVIDFDPEKQRVSLGLKQLQPHPWDSVDTSFPSGSVITGKVVSMTNYGAFIELERGVEGLVHVSEMSWTKHIRHPSEMFTLGESIEAKILNVDLEERKISLGVKQLQPDPWDHIEERYEVDSIHEGVVRNLTQFGAFVELEEGVDGLIHVTDLSWTRNVRHPKECLDKGDKVKVRILDVSRENRRIALGLKQGN
ncbi:MAG: 30S ribosomal protein S1, partial [Candidatus Marinimicrobia bacterium]|nr:30S ribosomal protein S1 [Candidatus Neomarinimicrobiota bacterium]